MSDFELVLVKVWFSSLLFLYFAQVVILPRFSDTDSVVLVFILLKIPGNFKITY